MLIGASEGDRFRFEIVLMSDGFIVRVRSNESGEVFGSRDRLFRTASAAFAFAEKSALKDAEDAVSATGLEALEASMASDKAARVFDDIRERLADSGVSAGQLAAWEQQSRQAAPRSVN